MHLQYSVCILFSLFGVYLGAPAELSDAKSARILKFDQDDSGKGSYRYGFESSDGITKEESGEIHYAGTKREFMKVTGVFSYPGPDGVMYEVRYTADDQGFHPEGDHIKVPPFVPWVHHDDEPGDAGDSETGQQITQVILTTPKPTAEYLPTATTYLPSSPSSTPKPFYNAGESVLETFGSSPSMCAIQPQQCAAPAQQEGFGSTPAPNAVYLPSTGGPAQADEARSQSFLSTPSPNPEVQFNSAPPQLRNFRAATPAPAPQIGKTGQSMMMLFIGPMGPQFIPIMK